MLGERDGLALRGRADLRQHGRAGAGRDHRFEQGAALAGGVQMELARRARHDEAVHSGVDQQAPERRRRGEIDLLAVVIERE